MAEAPAAELTNADADKFAIKVNGAAVANATAVAKVASDISGKTYRLTVATLDNTQGTLEVNGATKAFDFKIPEITGVIVKDKNHIVVNFSEEIAAAAVAANTTKFNVYNAITHAGGVASTDAVLNADKKSVTVAVGAPDLSPANYTLIIDTATLADPAGNKIIDKTQVEFTVTAADLSQKVAPALASAKYNAGEGKLTVTFNKVIDDALLDVTKLSINTYSLLVSDIESSAANDNQIVITLSSASKTAVNALTGALTLNAAAGAFGSAADEVTAGDSVAITKETPAVITSASYVQETNILTLNFDQAVTLENATVVTAGVSAANKVDVTRAMAVETPTTTARATWTFDLTKDTNKAATLEGYTPTSDTLKVWIAADAVKNAEKVANILGQDTYDKGVKATYTADVTKPVLETAAYDNLSKELKLTFSEKIDATIAKVKVADIKIMSGATATIDDLTGAAVQGVDLKEAAASSKTLTFVLKDNSAGGGTDLSAIATAIETAYASGKTMKVVFGAASVVIDEATLGSVATTYDTGIALDFSDYSKPTVTAFTEATQAPNSTHLQVVFSEGLDPVSAQTIDNYTIVDGTGTALTVSAAVLMADGKTVMLTTAAQTSGKPYYATIKNVKDRAGNIMVTATGTDYDFLGSGTPAQAAFKLNSFTAKILKNSQNDVLVVKFSNTVDQTSAASIANYSVLKKGAQADYSDATAVSLTGAEAKVTTADTVTITLKNSVNLEYNKEYKIIVQNVKDIYGNALGAQAADYSATDVTGNEADEDKTLAKPVVTEFQVDGDNNDYVQLVFSEELNATTARNKANYAVAGKTITGASYSWDAATGKATIILNVLEDFTVAVDVTVKKEVVNLAGITIDMAPADTTILAASVTLKDATKPTIASAVAKAVSGGQDTVVITFSKDLVQASAQLKANYTLKDASGNTLSLTDANVAYAAKAVTITLPDGTTPANKPAVHLQNATNVSVTVAGVVDTAGNAIDTVTKVVTWDGASDAIVPTFTFTAAAEESTLVLTFSEDIVTTGIDKSYFVVQYDDDNVDGGAVPLNPIFVSSTGSKNITITLDAALPAAAAKANDRVLLNIATGKEIVDYAGNKTAHTVVTANVE